MQIKELVPFYKFPCGVESTEISYLTANSQEVVPGSLYIGLESVDPTKPSTLKARINQAIEKGASIILTESPELAVLLPSVYSQKNLRQSLPQIAANFFQVQPAFIAAITGTSGKTSTSDFSRQLWRLLGRRSASLGTLGLNARISSETDEVSQWFENNIKTLTSLDPINLHHCLAQLSHAGASHLAMEASSHGLKQHRLDSVKLSAAVFTNLSPEHLDYHQDMQEYFECKQRLFSELLPPGGVAILNSDIEQYDLLRALCKQRGHQIIDFGRQATEIRLVNVIPTKTGYILHLNIAGKAYEAILPLVGNFQIYNALGALATLFASGITPEEAVPMLTQLEGVRGRLEHVGETSNGANVYVDYAHKEDALKTVLSALRTHTTGKLVVVFGCGGNRDPYKRPKMGAIATELADYVIVTDDNPRLERPAAIRQAILAGCHSTTLVKEIGDRRSAIKHGVEILEAGDILVVAGKGHELGQEIENKSFPFDDAQVIRELLYP